MVVEIECALASPITTAILHSVNWPAPTLSIEPVHLQAAHVRSDPTAPNGSVVMFGPPQVVTVLGPAW